jgi:hypothetical protein
LWGKVVHQRFELFHVGRCEKVSFEGRSEEMLRLVQRASCNLHKTPVVLKIVAARSFGNVRANAVGTTSDLSADGVFGKCVPSAYNFPNLIGQFLGQFVDTKLFKICPAHDFRHY